MAWLMSEHRTAIYIGKNMMTKIDYVLPGQEDVHYNSEA